MSAREDVRELNIRNQMLRNASERKDGRGCEG